ncbi:MAG: DJ-1/PfpI family protein [Oscillospiraceae bacterium]|nr:DJ-1/PfpI family protein [Oscillospiraceae bacterium]
MIYLFLATGFEETEAIAPIDVMRRAGVEVKTVCVDGTDGFVTGSHGITVKADINLSDVKLDKDIQGVVLPGGMPGTTNLEASKEVLKAIQYCFDNDKLVAAICAAPSILGHMGLLKSKKATCFPGYEKELHCAVFTGGSVTIDGNVITSDGAGNAVKFGEAITGWLLGGSVARRVTDAMQCRI